MKRVIIALLLALNLFASSFEDGLQAYEAGDYKSAFKLWLPLAQGGDKDVQYRIGWMYAKGEGIEKDKQKAKYWIHKSNE